MAIEMEEITMRLKPVCAVQDLEKFLALRGFALTEAARRTFLRLEEIAQANNNSPQHFDFLLALLQSVPEFRQVVAECGGDPAQAEEVIAEVSKEARDNLDSYSMEEHPYLASVYRKVATRNLILDVCLGIARGEHRREIRALDILAGLLEFHDAHSPPETNEDWTDEQLHTSFNSLSHVVEEYQPSLWVKFDDLRERLDLPTLPCEGTGVLQFDHPLIQHKLTLLRDAETEPKRFRELIREVTWLLLYEATADLALRKRPVTSPMGETAGAALSQAVAFAPILRAGLGMVEPALEMIPTAQVWHLGIYRAHHTLEPVEYYNNLPDHATAQVVFILDPMLATGGSAVMAVDMLKEIGVPRIKFVGIIAAPEGVERLSSAHPDVDVHVAAVDDHLNDVGYIVPGLGDAGDR